MDVSPYRGLVVENEVVMRHATLGVKSIRHVLRQIDRLSQKLLNFLMLNTGAESAQMSKTKSRIREWRNGVEWVTNTRRKLLERPLEQIIPRQHSSQIPNSSLKQANFGNGGRVINTRDMVQDLLHDLRQLHDQSSGEGVSGRRTPAIARVAKPVVDGVEFIVGEGVFVVSFPGECEGFFHGFGFGVFGVVAWWFGRVGEGWGCQGEGGEGCEEGGLPHLESRLLCCARSNSIYIYQGERK